MAITTTKNPKCPRGSREMEPFLVQHQDVQLQWKTVRWILETCSRGAKWGSSPFVGTCQRSRKGESGWLGCGKFILWNALSTERNGVLLQATVRCPSETTISEISQHSNRRFHLCDIWWDEASVIVPEVSEKIFKRLYYGKWRATTPGCRLLSGVMFEGIAMTAGCKPSWMCQMPLGCSPLGKKVLCNFTIKNCY